MLRHEDLNDQQTLRADLLMQTAVGRTQALASAPTLSRLDNRATRVQVWALHGVLLDQFVSSHAKAPEQIVLDIDASDVPFHGNQELSEFHAYYDHHCYLPLYVFCGQAMLACSLRRSRIVRVMILCNTACSASSVGAATSEKPATERVKLDPEMGARHPLRILLAEDNRVNQKLALTLLEQMGYAADIAKNGLEAVKAVADKVYDLILMDVQMPDMDGLEAPRNIRAEKKFKQPRIIGLAANACKATEKRALRRAWMITLPNRFAWKSWCLLCKIPRRSHKSRLSATLK